MTPRDSPRPCRSCTSSCSPPGGWCETSARRWPSSETFSGRADRESDLRSRSFRGRAGRVTSNSASSMESTGPTPSMWSSSNGSKGGRHLLKGRRRLAIEVRRSIEEPARVGKLWEAMERGRANRAATIEKTGLDLSAFRDRVRSIKETAAQDPSIADAFAEAVRANGGRVFFAATARDGVRYVLDICRANGAEFLVKSKSLTSEEIEMNQGLAAEGIRAIETDLGELLCQVAGEKPSHLVFPAIHMTSDRIARMLTQAYGEAIAPEPSSILSAVRARLRPQFLAATVGVTGANIGIAETGSIVVETNEGNGRLVTSVPRVHIALIGLEKIVRRWEDAADLVRGHAISATGQRMTVYVSLISQRQSVAGDPMGREFHVIILDNGRTRMRADPVFREALNCIRCGACMNVCPTYGVTGGHVFGHIYPGPIGIPWTANVHGLEEAGFAHLCVSCGLCHEICPVDIDIPLMIAKVKDQDVEAHGQPTAERFFMASEAFAKVACLSAPLANRLLRRGSLRVLMEWAVGVDRRRTLPAFAHRTLRSRFRAREGQVGRVGKVAFFRTCTRSTTTLIGDYGRSRSSSDSATRSSSRTCSGAACPTSRTVGSGKRRSSPRTTSGSSGRSWTTGTRSFRRSPRRCTCSAKSTRSSLKGTSRRRSRPILAASSSSSSHTSRSSPFDRPPTPPGSSDSTSPVTIERSPPASRRCGSSSAPRIGSGRWKRGPVAGSPEPSG